MTLTWHKQPTFREVARGMRAATRKARSLDGHHFSYRDLKELWSAGDHHIICTHEADPVWQHWHRGQEGGWVLRSCHESLLEAQMAAECVPQHQDKAAPGRYVIAWRPGGRTIRIACRTGDPSIQRGIFERLGYETSVEEVA